VITLAFVLPRFAAKSWNNLLAIFFDGLYINLTFPRHSQSSPWTLKQPGRQKQRSAHLNAWALRKFQMTKERSSEPVRAHRDLTKPLSLNTEIAWPIDPPHLAEATTRQALWLCLSHRWFPSSRYLGDTLHRHKIPRQPLEKIFLQH
jgi:hypothetical protein